MTTLKYHQQVKASDDLNINFVYPLFQNATFLQGFVMVMERLEEKNQKKKRKVGVCTRI